MLYIIYVYMYLHIYFIYMYTHAGMHTYIHVGILQNHCMFRVEAALGRGVQAAGYLQQPQQYLFE